MSAAPSAGLWLVRFCLAGLVFGVLACGLAHRTHQEDAAAKDGDGRGPDAATDAGGGGDATVLDASADGPRDAGATDAPCCDAAVDGTWRVTVVDNEHEAHESSLVTDGDALHVVYRDASGSGQSLRYAHRPPGGEWEADVVVSFGFVGFDPSLAIDDDGALHVTYTDLGLDQLGYAFKAKGEAWSMGEVADVEDDGWARRSSLVVGREGDIHVVFQRTFPSDDLVYLRRSEGTWLDPEPVDTEGVLLSGGDGALDIDPAGGLHAVYLDHSNDALEYAYGPPLDGGSETPREWTTDTIASFRDGAGGDASLAEDAGDLHVSFFDAEVLRYLYRAAGGDWSSPVAVTARGGEEHSLAVDGEGGVHLCYYDPVLHDLGYVHRAASGEWLAPEVIDSEGDVGKECSLAVDAGGGVHVTYRDADARSLKYAHLPR